MQVAASDNQGRVTFDSIYAFGHRDHTSSQSFVKLSTATTTLRLTAGHFLKTSAGVLHSFHLQSKHLRPSGSCFRQEPECELTGCWHRPNHGSKPQAGSRCGAWRVRLGTVSRECNADDHAGDHRFAMTLLQQGLSLNATAHHL